MIVKSFCKAENFQQITNIKEGVDLVRFTKKPLISEVYEDGEPTGRYEDTGYVTFTEANVKGGVTVDKLIPLRLEELAAYDASEEVNIFYVNGKKMWFDKVTRTCIVYSMQTEKASGATETTLYDNDNVPYVLPIDAAIQMFGALELYAKACYNKTAEHAAEIKALESVQDVLDYDITVGYPEKLTFNLTIAE
jgi:hypothetical protein